MGSTGILLFAGAVLLVAAMIASGCVQDNGSSTQVPAGQATPGPGAGSGAGARYGGQNGGQRFQPNFTAAAQQLGVTEQQLRDALNTTSQGRRNLTAAAQQLGVTSQQLADALGFRFNASAPRPASQPPQGG